VDWVRDKSIRPCAILVSWCTKRGKCRFSESILTFLFSQNRGEYEFPIEENVFPEEEDDEDDDSFRWETDEVCTSFLVFRSP
jgi:hypothetical protein